MAAKTRKEKMKPKVTVTKTGGGVVSIDYVEGITLGRAIEEAGFRAERDGGEVRVNGHRRKKMDRPLAAGDQVQLLGFVAGG